jgi:queuine tRNA-ribosyltransferase
MDIQRSIGGDIIMAFDECPPYPSEYRYAQKSMELTHRWLDRCFDRFNEMPDKYGYSQNLFPIVQGSTFKDLRTASSEYIASKNAAGNAIGGLSVGEPEQMMYDFTELCCDILPANKPRYLIDDGIPCHTSQYYTKAYVRHLFVSNEILALQIASIHNLAFYLWLVTEARKHILDNTFNGWKQGMISVLKERL